MKEKNLRQKKMIHRHLRYGYFETVNQIFIDDRILFVAWVVFVSAAEVCPEYHCTGTF